MNDDRRRSVWNIVSLIATLGLAAVVAVAAVTRSEPSVPGGGGSPSPSVSPSPTPSGPGSLSGRGPYVVYATGSDAIVAYDVSAGQWIEMGAVDGRPVLPHERQPAPGGVVAFATEAGTVWRVDREGLERVALLPASGGRLAGGVVSRDERRFAVASTAADRELLVVNLANGRTAAYPREEGSSQRYPPEPLVPVGWSLGGSLVYQVPLREGEEGSRGLYIYDLGTERSSLIPATSSYLFDRFALAPDGQQLVWSDLEEQPYTLRRLAAGRSSVRVLRRDADERVVRLVWAAGGDALVLATFDPDAGVTAYELADPDSGDATRPVRGVAGDVVPLGLLPGRVLVFRSVAEGGAIRASIEGTVTTIADAGDEAVFLGWLR